MTEYNLDRFIKAQEFSYKQALCEIKAGKKRSHWIWYIFPQLKSLGRSNTAVYYGIVDLDEARAYMTVPYLRNNLIEITKALLELEETDPGSVMGYPDNLKLCSSMTLFEIAAPDVPEFGMVIDKFYNGIRDILTINMCIED